MFVPKHEGVWEVAGQMVLCLAAEIVSERLALAGGWGVVWARERLAGGGGG